MTAREGNSWNIHLIFPVLSIAVSLKSLPETGRVHCLPAMCFIALEQLRSSLGNHLTDIFEITTKESVHHQCQIAQLCSHQKWQIFITILVKVLSPLEIRNERQLDPDYSRKAYV